MGYPTFDFRTNPNGSNGKRLVSAILAASQFALTQKLLVYEAMVKLCSLHLYEFVGVKKGHYPVFR